MAGPSYPDPSAAPRPRPITELALDSLRAHADELARRWAIALILARAPSEMGEVPLEDLAREGPALCAQVLLAVSSDSELERLIAGDAASARAADADASSHVHAGRLRAICGARDPVALVHAVEALREVLWEALLAELRQPRERLLADLSDRLAHICSSTLAAALAPATDVSGAELPQPHERMPARVSLEHRGDAPIVRGETVIVDERAHTGSGSSPHHATAARKAPERSWEDPASGLAGSPTEEIAVRDRRRREGPAAWISSIGTQLERFEHDGRPFAVLLVELLDIRRVRSEELSGELMQMAAHMEEALSSALDGRAHSLTRERPGRCWVLAPGLDRAGAEQLAERLIAALASPTHDRGSALVAGAAGHALGRQRSVAVAIGTAVCPEDGRRAAALAAHADVGLYAARAAARAQASAR